jgi:hypothetical protein
VVVQGVCWVFDQLFGFLIYEELVIVLLVVGEVIDVTVVDVLGVV